jgi:hypothetical protein
MSQQRVHVRVETKIFVFVFSWTFFFAFREKLRKVAKIFAKLLQNFLFLRKFCAKIYVLCKSFRFCKSFCENFLFSQKVSQKCSVWRKFLRKFSIWNADPDSGATWMCIQIRTLVDVTQNFSWKLSRKQKFLQKLLRKQKFSRKISRKWKQKIKFLLFHEIH